MSNNNNNNNNNKAKDEINVPIALSAFRDKILIIIINNAFKAHLDASASS